MKRIPFAVPSVGIRERYAVWKALKSKWLTSGPICRRFEQEFAIACNARHAVAVNSATAGLHVSLAAAGFRDGDVCCLSPYTFTASATVALHLRMKLQFIDIETQGYNIDCALLEESIKKMRQKSPKKGLRIAIMAVHIAGHMCDMRRIRHIANQYECSVIEDAAHCQPCIGEGGTTGNRGDCVVFSFYATKPLTTGEGGMVITDNDELAQKIRVLCNHGMNKSLWARSKQRTAYWRYDIEMHGYKYNLPDPLAAMGRVQLRRAHTHWRARRSVAEYYARRLQRISWLSPPLFPPTDKPETHAWHLFLCQLRPDRLNITRDQLITALYAYDVQCSLHYIPLHCTLAYKREFGYSETDYAQATMRYRNVISLPIYPQLTQSMRARVIDAIHTVEAEYTTR